MRCTRCGNELAENARFCRTCGQPVATPVMQQPPVQYAQQMPPYQPVKPKKKKGCLIALLAAIAVITAIVLCVALFLPGFFGPKNLGVRSSKAAYERALTKLNYTKDDAPDSGSPDDYTYTYGSPTDVNTALTSEELTSFFNYNRPDYYALKKVQIRINDDDTAELSAQLDTRYFLDKILDGKYSEDDVKKAVPFIDLIPKNINIYAKLSGEIQDNKPVGFEFEDIQIMGVGLPESLYNTASAKDEVANLLGDFLTKTTEKTGGRFDLVKINDGKLELKGKLPSSLKREEAG